MNSIGAQKKIFSYGLFISIGAIVACLFSMGSPSDPENAFIFGYSLERILIGTLLLSIGIIIFLFTLTLARNSDRSSYVWGLIFQRKDTSYTVFIFALALFLVIWIFLFLPSYRIGILSSYLSRLFPLLIWLLLVSSLSVLLYFLEIPRNELLLKGNKYILKNGLLVFCAMGVLVAFIAITGIGTSYPADYWYGAGVPVLGLQVFFSIVAGIVFIFLEPKIKFNKSYLDLVLFISIWVVAAIFWSRQPLSTNYFMPDTADNQIYPYSDAATYDQGAQYALIGQGVFNSNYFDNTLYSVLLTYFHLALGQNFSVLMVWQAAFYAVLASIVYLIGKELHSRALGISAGVLIALRGINAVVSAKWIDTASPKMMLTDFPAAIGIAIFIWVMLKYLNQPEKNSRLIWVGAVFGLTLMVRTHVLTLLPVTFLFIVFVLKLSWKKAILAGLLVITGLFVVTLPWEIRNQSKGIPMFYVYYYRIEVILINRYGLDIGSATPLEDIHQGNVFQYALSKPIARLRVNNIGPSENFSCDNTVCSIFNHFFHNVVTSFASLPSTPFFDDLWNTVKGDTPYWKKNWSDGHIGVLGMMMMVLNMALISLGIGTIGSRSKKLAFLPVLIFFTYLATNSIGFTSGGRYIAPVDWIVYIFYIAGGLRLYAWFMGLKIPLVSDEVKTFEESKHTFLEKVEYSKLVVPLFSILLLGSILPLSDFIAKPRYKVQTPDEILANLDAKGLIEQSGFSREELVSFLSQPTAMIHEGRILYPRYYPSGDGEQDQTTFYRYLDYQRLAFTLIGPYSENIEGVIIPGNQIKDFSIHAEDAVVLGCWNTTYNAPFIDAVVVFVTSGDGYVYTRSPGVPLQCPLPEPNP